MSADGSGSLPNPREVTSGRLWDRMLLQPKRTTRDQPAVACMGALGLVSAHDATGINKITANVLLDRKRVSPVKPLHGLIDDRNAQLDLDVEIVSAQDLRRNQSTVLNHGLCGLRARARGCLGGWVTRTERARIIRDR
jgi:hypothetical protein